MDSSITVNARGRWLDGLIDYVEAYPRRVFLAFSLLHVSLWTLLPSLLCPNPPMDILEGVAYGQEWQLGYWKHPPLVWWLDSFVYQIVGPNISVFFLLGQLAVVIGFWAIWRLGCEILRPVEALLAVVLLDGCIGFNFDAIEFNHNPAQYPIWGLAAWSLYRAFILGRRMDWALTGLWFAVAFYTKYSVVTLLIPLLLFAVIDREARRAWKTPGPYLAMLVFTLLVAPNAVWVVQSHFSPLGFWEDRAPPVQGLVGLVGAIGTFLSNALLEIALVLVLFAALQGRLWSLPSPAPTPTIPSERFARRYVSTLALGPVALALIVQGFSMRDFRYNWAEQFWLFSGLFLVLVWRPMISRAALHRFILAWAGVTIALVLALVGGQASAAGGLHRTKFPGGRLATTVADEWHREFGRPLTYVVGNWWLAGNLTFFSTDRPHMFYDASLRYSPWIDEGDVKRRGAVLLWLVEGQSSEMPEALRARFQAAQPRDPLVLRSAGLFDEHIWRIGWAIVPPQTGPAVDTPHP